MKTDDIERAIQALPDEEIKPLLDWLRDYYDGPVWERQIEADIERLGPDRFMAILQADMEQKGERHKAALRLLNNLQFRSQADRQQCLKDLSLLIGESLGEDGKVGSRGAGGIFGSLYEGPLPGEDFGSREKKAELA